MSQRFHTIRADSLDEAYETLRRDYDEEAVVLRTARIKEGGLFGFMGRPRIELTVATPESRPKSAAERRYAAMNRAPRAESGTRLGVRTEATDAARPGEGQRFDSAEKEHSSQHAGVGSDDRFASTVNHFQEILSRVHAAQQPQKKRTDAPPPETGASKTPLPGTPPGGAARRLHTVNGESSVIPFRKEEHAQSSHPPEARPAIDLLRSEVRDIHDSINVLMVESPVTGIPTELQPHYRNLVERGMGRKLAATVIGNVVRHGAPRDAFDPSGWSDRIKEELCNRFETTGGIHITPGQRQVVALVGTTGVGKTTTLAKLASIFALRRRAKVALVTTDTYRIGAADQLKVYADIIGLPMQVANDANEAAAAVRAFSRYDLVLIDTVGGSQFNVRHLQELRVTLGAARPTETMLLLQAGADPEDLAFVIENYQCLLPTALIFTKLDETRRFGAMFTTLVESGLPVSYVSAGQNVPDDLQAADAGSIAGLVVEGRLSRGRSSS